MKTTRQRVESDPGSTVAKKFRLHVPLPRVARRVLPMGTYAPIQPPREGVAFGRPPPPPPVATRTGHSDPDFDDFYRANYALVTRLAYSLCGSIGVAEELAQESFVAAHGRWRRISRFDRPDLWVRRVVINRSISYRRKATSERKALRRVVERRQDEAEPQLADDEVWSALRELSGRQSEVLALVYVEDRPIAEVAAILRLGEETVRTHLKRGRAALAVKLGPSRAEVTE